MFGVRSSYEAPDYSVVQALSPAAEVRSYAPRLAAQATVENAEPGEGRNAAFRLLFDYISGKNRVADSIAMTVPVETNDGQSIAMTVPVETASGDEAATMRFFLPKRYTLETAPQPVDPRIKIVPIPAETLAVLTYSGSTSPEKASEKQQALLALLAETDWQPSGEASSLFYDPPWTLWFLRRNETVIPVAR